MQHVFCTGQLICMAREMHVKQVPTLGSGVLRPSDRCSMQGKHCQALSCDCQVSNKQAMSSKPMQCLAMVAVGIMLSKLLTELHKGCGNR